MQGDEQAAPLGGRITKLTEIEFHLDPVPLKLLLLDFGGPRGSDPTGMVVPQQLACSLGLSGRKRLAGEDLIHEWWALFAILFEVDSQTLDR